MQKLSYRDQVIVIVVLIIAIGVAGVMLLIKPKMNDIKTAKADLETKQAEWTDLETKINQIDSIKERIQKKYAESVELGNLFVDVKVPYTLDGFIKEYIDRNAIYIKSTANYSEASIVGLTPYTYNQSTLNYSIQEYANLNEADENSDGDTDAVEVQSLPCGTISIDFNTTRGYLMQFMQELKDSGKTMEIKTLNISEYGLAPESPLTGDITIDVYFAQMISDLDINAEIAGIENPDAQTTPETPDEQATPTA